MHLGLHGSDGASADLHFFRQKNPFPRPLFYYDVQKLFSLAFEDGKSRRSLKDAVEYLGLEEGHSLSPGP